MSINFSQGEISRPVNAGWVEVDDAFHKAVETNTEITCVKFNPSMNSTEVSSAAIMEHIFQAPGHAFVQVKGWGSGVKPSDYASFISANASLPSPENDHERFIRVATALVVPRIDVFAETNKGRSIFIQWDGDKIGPGAYTMFIYAVAKALNDHPDVLFGGFICTKLTTGDKAAGYADKFMNENGGRHLLQTFGKPLITMAFHTEKNEMIKAFQKNSKFGYFGASMNGLLAGSPTLVMSFGGGDVLLREYVIGYHGDTEFSPYNITRKGGAETSAFTSHDFKDPLAYGW